jgi:PAS domain S-box-containing protein
MEGIKQQFIDSRIEELQRSTDFVNNLLKRITGYSIVVGDFDGNIVVFNEGAHQIFGFDPQNVVGIKNIEDFYPSHLVESGILNLLFDNLIKEGECSFELNRKRKNGEIFPGQSLLALVKDNEGRLVGFVEITEDITERKQKERQIQELYRKEKQQRLEMEASEEFNRKIIANAPNPILVTAIDSSIIQANPALEKMTGYSSEEILGKKIPYPWWPKEKLLDYALDYISGRNQGTIEQERCFIKKNGQSIWVLQTIEPIKYDGDVRYFLANWVDYTERKNAHEQLEKANQRLIELDKLKDTFISMVSHELRTPLTSIKSFTEILLNCDEDNATQKEFLGIIDSESNRLLRLINDFLDISKIQAGRMQWKKIELSINDVIQQAIISNSPLIKAANLELKTEFGSDLPPVIGDKDRLVQVVTNLLGNSLKFTPESGRIMIKSCLGRGSYPENSRDMIIVSISDTGIGIAPDNFERIFETFGQVGNTLKDRPKGTGLGLPICKKIVEYFGGKIWVESELGRGSTFYFSLPLAGETAHQAAVRLK